MEYLDDKELLAGDLQTNSALFVNLKYKLDAATTVGVELAQHTTDYLDGKERDSLRLQIPAIFAFKSKHSRSACA
jgi:hypothetical protein